MDSDIAKSLPAVLYKYREWNDKTKNILSKGEFFFASPKSFNDPLDCAIEVSFPESHSEFFDRVAERKAHQNPQRSYDEWRREIQREFRKGRISKKKMTNDLLDIIRHRKDERSGIISFTSDPSSFLMWSHYADSHKGVCVGVSSDILQNFLIAETKNSRFEFGLRKVNYYKYPNLSFFPRSSGEDHNKHLKEVLEVIFSTKSEPWSYEKEFRLIMLAKIGKDIRDSERRISFPEAIREVILGQNISSHDEKEIREALHGRTDIVLKKALNARKEFAIEIVIV